MSKATTKQATLNGNLKLALSAEPDFSEAFTERVSSLKCRIGGVLASPIEHDTDMNYSAAQKIVVWLDKSCQAVPPRDSSGKYRVIDYVSSKGPFFAFVVMMLSGLKAGLREKGLDEPRNYWTLLAGKDVPTKIASVQKKISSVMKSNNFTLLEGSILSEEAEGHLTELDGKPATVFEVLFSEV